MNFRYPTFDDWYNDPNDGLASLRSEYLTASKVDLLATFDAARETVEEEDLDHLATLEWVRGRPGWLESIHNGACHYMKPNHGNAPLVFTAQTFVSPTMLYIGNDTRAGKDWPTRRHIIAAEWFAKEMGWA